MDGKYEPNALLTLLSSTQNGREEVSQLLSNVNELQNCYEKEST